MDLVTLNASSLASRIPSMWCLVWPKLCVWTEYVELSYNKNVARAPSSSGFGSWVLSIEVKSRLQIF
ncbi:hypothetical protein ACVWZ4_001123 [Bradyrhizobium sp. USDA 4472]